MNSLRLLVPVLLFFTLSSCEQKKEIVIEKKINSESANVDSLMGAFVSGWNNSDSTAIMNTLAPDAIVMNDSLIHTGADAIAANWVSGGVKVLSNIKTQSIMSGSSALVAYDAGTYSLDLTIPNGPVLKERGNYNMVWEKNNEQGWRLKVVHIEDITRMPDVTTAE